MREWQQKFLIALQFITRIPVNQALDLKPRLIAGSMAFYPVVGTGLGGVLAGVEYFSRPHLSGLARSGLIITTLILLTGGLHLDGLMDAADGLFGGQTKSERLEIMSDSRVGSFGVLALLLVILLKFSLIADLSPNISIKTLVYFPTISRWLIVYTAYKHSYAREEGLGKVYADHLQQKHLLAATAWAIVLGGLLFGLNILIIVFGCWLVLLKISKKVKQDLGGFTGDIYGAVNEIEEVVALLVIVIIN